MITANQFPVTNILKIFVGMNLIMLQYHVTFLLKENIFAVASSLTGNLPFKICSTVDVFLNLKAMKHWETVPKFSTP